MSVRPKWISKEPMFLICEHCNKLVVQEKVDNTSTIICCSEPMHELVPHTAGNLSESHLPIITFTGGFSANTANVKIGSIPHAMSEEHHIEWVYLRTTQGGQFKHLTVGKEPVVRFAFADEDAYSYCNRSVCQMGWGKCKFNCKRGFTAYAFCNLHGLWKTEM